MFEHAVTETVTGLVRALSGAGLRRCRPEVPGLFITQVNGFAAAIGDRIVVPGRQAKFVGIFGPGIGTAGFRDHRAEMCIGDHVDPGRGCRIGREPGDDVLTAIGAEAAIFVAQQQEGTVRSYRCRPSLKMPGRHKRRVHR